jgi:hypothetical protein
MQYPRQGVKLKSGKVSERVSEEWRRRSGGEGVRGQGEKVSRGEGVGEGGEGVRGFEKK